LRGIQLQINRVISILFLELIFFSLTASLLLINVETTILLLIFNSLFVSLVFQLNGTFTRKLGLLAAGNALGLFCNFIFISFSIVGVEYFGQVFNVFYALSYPILNTLWMVTFWSLSLTALPKPANVKTEKAN
jgi:hypothetical protein